MMANRIHRVVSFVDDELMHVHRGLVLLDQLPAAGLINR